MPRHVDHDQRRREILEATWRVLGERGVKGLSFRAIANELGGSTTLVTHYFDSQADLIQELAVYFSTAADAEIAELEEGAGTPYERLLILLEWLVPSTEDGVVQERARIVLLADRLAGEDLSENFEVWETKTRELLRNHLEEMVSTEELELRVEMLRVLTNGLTLSAIEHPELWPGDRQLAIIRQAVADMGLATRRRGRRKAPQREVASTRP